MQDVIEPLIPIGVAVTLIGATIYGAFSLRRRQGFSGVDPGIGTIRRIYFYLVSFVTLIMTANGLVILGSMILDRVFEGPALSNPDATRIALGLSLSLVGLPLWGFHWRLVSGHVRDIPVETQSVARKIYLYTILGISLVMVISSSIDILQWLFGAGSYDGHPWTSVVIWSALWFYHWKIESGEGQPSLGTLIVRRLYIYPTVSCLLIASSVGVGQIVHTFFLTVFDALTSAGQLNNPGITEVLTEALPILLVTIPLWAIHWLYFARTDLLSTMRQLYLYLLGGLGGLVTILTATGIIIFGFLDWIIGNPTANPARDHFMFLPNALTAILVGITILSYHVRVASKEAQDANPATDRARKSYPYVLVSIGLLVLVIGISALVNSAIGILDDLVTKGHLLTGAESWRDTTSSMSFGITLVLLGLPLWGYFWRSVQTFDGNGYIPLFRRTFVFGAIGAGILTMVVAVSTILFVVIKALVDGSVSDIITDSKLSMSIIIPVGMFLPYHWMVYQSDRDKRAEISGKESNPPPTKSVTVLTSGTSEEFTRELESVLGYSVTLLHWTNPDSQFPVLSSEEYSELSSSIGAVPSENVLLIPHGNNVRVISYR